MNSRKRERVGVRSINRESRRERTRKIVRCYVLERRETQRLASCDKQKREGGKGIKVVNKFERRRPLREQQLFWVASDKRTVVSFE